MWGKVTRDANMEARANLQLAVQARSMRNYFLLESDNQNQPPQFIPNKVTGILFENKVDHTTYFGRNIEYIQGIHMIPINPSSAYTRSARFVQEEWDTYFSNGRAEQAEGGWRHILKSNQALIDPQASYNHFADPNFDGQLDGGASRTWYLAYAAALLNARTEDVTVDAQMNYTIPGGPDISLPQGSAVTEEESPTSTQETVSTTLLPSVADSSVAAALPTSSSSSSLEISELPSGPATLSTTLPNSILPAPSTLSTVLSRPSTTVPTNPAPSTPVILPVTPNPEPAPPAISTAPVQMEPSAQIQPPDMSWALQDSAPSIVPIHVEPLVQIEAPDMSWALQDKEGTADVDVAERNADEEWEWALECDDEGDEEAVRNWWNW
jgi:hypothetical protein